MISCPEFQENTLAWLDGELEEAQRAAMDAHWRNCPACRAMVAQMQRVAERLRQAAQWHFGNPPPPPSSFWRRPFGWRRNLWWLVPLVAVLLFSLGWAAFRNFVLPPEVGRFGCRGIGNDFVIEVQTPQQETVRLQVWDERGRLAADFWFRTQPMVIYRWRLSELLQQPLRSGVEYRARATRGGQFWGEVWMFTAPPSKAAEGN
jgi:hypothetical protein